MTDVSTYTGDPANNTRDEVRFLLSDTGPTTFLFNDAEILFLVNTYGGGLYGAIQGAITLASRYAGSSDKQVGDLKISASSLAANYTALAGALRRQLLTGPVYPVVGGISIADKRAEESDTDRINPFATRGMHDMPGNPQAGGRSVDLSRALST